MRIDKLWIGKFKNLIDVNIDFDETNLTTVLIGRNATGKSNLIEALVLIFRDLDLHEDPRFKYRLGYVCRGKYILIDADPNREKKIQITVDGKPLSYTTFARDPQRQYLPANVFGYYSGPSGRLEHHFDTHQDRFYHQLLEGKETPLRPLFYARDVHSQYVLLAFFSFADETPLRFLRDYLGITAFESATFVLKQPRWYNKARDKADLFWGARGVVRGFLDQLRAVAEMKGQKKTQRVDLQMGRVTYEEQISLHLGDVESLRKLAAKFRNNVEFFKTLESTYISDLMRSLVIKVRKEGVKDSLEFTELSEGEQQLLTVLGLLRFTQEEESLFLLDEPDNYLNPAWKLEYMYLLRRVVGPNESSHVLLVTHDPLVVGSLRKEQVQVFSFKEGKRVWIAPPKEDPIGMGVAGLLTSELFGLRSELDLETLRKLDRKKDLAVKDELTPDEKAELLKLDEELATMGFLTTFRDPMYTQFLKALSEFDQSKTPTLTPQEREEQARLAKEIVTKLMMKQK